MIGFAIETSLSLRMKTWTKWSELGMRECLKSLNVWVFSSKENSIFFEDQFPSELHTFDGKFNNMEPPYAKKLIFFWPSNQVYTHHVLDQYCLSNHRWKLRAFYYQSRFYTWAHHQMNLWKLFRTERVPLHDISS